MSAIFPSDLSQEDFNRAARKAAAASPSRAEADAAAAEFAEQLQQFAGPEGVLLDLCSGVFGEKLAPAAADRAQAILQAVASLELDAKREGSSLQAEAARSSLLGDWRLVFTDSEQTLKGGVSGIGGYPFCSSIAVMQRLSENAPGAQCVEVVSLPLGVKNAVILKGMWKVDGDEEGAMLVCQYDATEVAGGGEMPPNVAAGAQNVVTAATHLGPQVRIERARNNAVFVWERQATPIEQTTQALVGT